MLFLLDSFLSMISLLVSQNIRAPCASRCKWVPLLSSAVWCYADLSLWVGTLPFLLFFQCWISALLADMDMCWTDISCLCGVGEIRVFTRARSLVPLNSQSVWITNSSVKLLFPLLDPGLSKYISSLSVNQRSFCPYPLEESQISLILCICAVIKLHFYY